MAGTDETLDLLRRASPLRSTGRVSSIVGLAIRASVPGVRVGDLVRIDRSTGAPLLAEAVGFAESDTLLMPLGDATGIGPSDAVSSLGVPLSVDCSFELLGRVLDGLGEPLDGKPKPRGTPRAVAGPAPNPLARPRITRQLALGVRAIDGLIAVGEGQRMGLFAGSGVGKSTLLGQIARQAEADVFVACLVGERGREVGEFLDESLGKEGLARGVVICATGDAPALVRMKSALTATAIAEWFRDQGKRVVLLMDSVTRFARAAREVGLAAGEPPARRGFPPSVFAALPSLLERSGTSSAGSITAFYTVLVEGGDMDEPVADEVRGILDGHIVLDRRVAERGRFPAIDMLQSLSRTMEHITSPTQRQQALAIRAALARYEEKRDLVLLGAYKKGTDLLLDDALARVPKIEAFLAQNREERAPLEETRAAMGALIR
jgi:type III secretion protein N (ATPase)